jgi:hypothetical protein
MGRDDPDVPPNPLSRNILRAVVRIPKGREQKGFVDLGANEADPFLQAVTIAVSSRGRQLPIRAQVGNVLQNSRILGQRLAIIQNEDRDRTFNGDPVKISIILQNFFVEDID